MPRAVRRPLERHRRCAPSPPRNRGLPRLRIKNAQVGLARLASGEGWGGGCPKRGAANVNPHPQPLRKGGGELTVLAGTFDSTALDRFLQLLGRAESHLLGSLDLDRLAG